MKRVSVTMGVLAAVTAAGMGGLWLTRSDLLPFSSKQMEMEHQVRASQRPLYYRDPDGKPAYALDARSTAGGRAYRPVYSSEDKVSFDTGEESEVPQASKIKFYRNPMGLADTSPVPKKDSMGMDYIPVYEGDAADDGSVRLTLGKLQRSGVKSVVAGMRVIRTVIRAPGTIQLDERRVSVISMRSESWLQKVSDVTTGSHVRKGEPLMEIYSPAITSAAAEYLAVRGSGSVSDTLNAGARQRLMNLNVPESALAAIEKGKAAPLAIAWTAPRDGIVLERNATEGMRVGPGDVLFRLADTSVVWTMIDVAERDLSLVKVGQAATMSARGFPGRTFEGKVAVVYPQLNKETRTVRVRIELPNADLALLPDMYVDAEIDVGSGQAVLAVPDSAVLDSGERQAVFVDKGNGRLEPRPVKLGARGGGYTEIRDGVVDGEAVVTSANFLIDAESNLNAALKGYSDAGSQP
jgi:Cu(I)/Ag(I) efflux system membrane fusion protein